jgi:uncharacterized membrane protein HdeD (DUF308 family)
MSTLAPAPHHAHLPGPRRLNQLGFGLGAAAGAVSYLLTPSVPLSFLVFVAGWYVIGLGIGEVAAHPAHRAQWAVHVALFPVTAALVAGVLAGFWLHVFWAVALGLLAGVALQAALTRLFLRGVVEDQRHDLRRRIGLE